MIFTSKEDIKTDEDLNIYGWNMRIMEVEDSIACLEKNRDYMIKVRDGIISSQTSGSGNKEDKDGDM